MTNIRKVAALAGVSVATVSRTLKSPAQVSPETREKVLDAVEHAGYKPNLMAIQFRSQRTRNLVVLVPDIANTFFAQVIRGIQEAASAFDYRVLLCNTLGNPETERQFAELVDARQADGVIQLRAFDPFARQDHPPLVNICEIVDDAPWPTVSLNNRGAARTMTEHLLGLGHRRIGLIQGPPDSPLTRERFAGYREALDAAGIGLDPALLQDGNYDCQSGHAAAAHLLQVGARPTAIFCENDEMAMGAIRCIRQAGLRIPEDISVAGFDDISFAAFCDPPLTTIAQPAEAFGQHAVAMLLALLEGKSITEHHLILPFELVVRSSTAACSQPPVEA
ncbi:LacI family repressor for deo operon, udp, cdd, tsx, nupC, and nupG [Pseudomonas sp. BIGb0408]|uniref:LacI family repressor for deo operon, udp, cdd, tsx, nupC, and nupG n=1 Tax=Phytopseudomonas flavescens TaxID=29435 RepID=A0A7Y9XHH5_9GAMM|nr:MULTISPECIES: LacI family DNA-binding transcriptional regulator [Pseudomonas]MCW2293997.1 LacI family repressor for deo operon, udp, cdd, tsx, nupC, and nupG [Pseudomonas sp. BIGb0408]NYH71433.1 LacI family repressor for deo operon, udp, cdd, tsx, nupC, and nupG [Pseudomonas flavescens]